MEKPNKIIKANGGKKKSSRSKRKKGFVYYGGDEEQHGWSSHADRTSKGWLDWEEEGWGWINLLYRYKLAFGFTEDAEKLEDCNNRELIIFRTRFFKSDHYKTLLSWIPEFKEFVESASDAGLFHDPKKTLIDMPRGLKTSDENQNYCYLKGMLNTLGLLGASHTFIVLKFSGFLNFSNIGGYDFDKLWVNRKYGFGEDVPTKDAQLAIDWFSKYRNWYLEIVQNVNWLVDEIGIASANLTEFGYAEADDAPIWTDEKEHQIDKFREYLDAGRTVPFYDPDFEKEGEVRVHSLALKSYLQDLQSCTVKARTKVLGSASVAKVEVFDLLDEKIPEAKRLLKNVHISKFKDMLEIAKDGFDSISRDNHYTNFRNYDLLEKRLHWLEDYLYNIGFWESLYTMGNIETNELAVGEFLELIEKVKRWANCETEGDLAQLQRMYFEVKERPKGTVKTATVNVKLFGNNDDPLLERLSDAIESVSPERTGCVMGDVAVIWNGGYVWRGRKDKEGNHTKKLTAPLADDLREHIVRFANDAPHGSFKETTQYGLKPALSPTWQKIFDVLPSQASIEKKAWLIDRTSVDEKGKIIDGSDPKPIKYRQPQGRTKHRANCTEVAQYLIDHCEPKELERNLDNYLNWAKSKQKKSAS